MAEQAEFDLVSIGGGFAGLVAALRGAELGLRTAVIEKGEDERYLCSSRWAGGIFHVSYHDVKLPPAELKAAIERATSGETDPELAARSPRIAPARSIGSRRTARISPAPARSTGTAGPWRRRARAVHGQDWRGRGPDLMIAALKDRLEQRQGRMFLGTRAAALRIAGRPLHRRRRPRAPAPN